MTDKIKKFFAKKKADAKFKLAGRGHKLTDDTTSNRSASSSSVGSQPKKRAEMSEEQKLAANAALLRLGNRKENPAFNTSLAAIQAQVKKELELEKLALEKAKSENEPETVPEAPLENLATTGVFFKCPFISNEVLPRKEWKTKIKDFLYEQLQEEKGLTACLIIQTLNQNKEKVNVCVETLCKYLENIITYPEEEKYQKIRVTNRAFQERVKSIEGAIDLLLAAGFENKQIENADGQTEEYYVFNKDKVDSVDILIALIEGLRSAEPIQLELDRNLKVLLPSQAAKKIELPYSFYTMTPEEVKKQQQLRLEAIESSQMLRTKAMREKDELREMKKYKYCLIRVRFPDGIYLQGTFSVYERFSSVLEFVRDALEHSGLPFALVSPTGQKLDDTDGDKNLMDLRLVPASVLTFSWDQSVVEEIQNSACKNEYLKTEIMLLVQNI